MGLQYYFDEEQIIFFIQTVRKSAVIRAMEYKKILNKLHMNIGSLELSEDGTHIADQVVYFGMLTTTNKDYILSCPGAHETL